MIVRKQDIASLTKTRRVVEDGFARADGSCGVCIARAIGVHHSDDRMRNQRARRQRVGRGDTCGAGATQYWMGMKESLLFCEDVGAGVRGELWLVLNPSLVVPLFGEISCAPFVFHSFGRLDEV